MSRTLHLAALATLLLAAAGMRAQITNPDNLVAAPPRNPADTHRFANNAAGDDQWLWAFTKPAPVGRTFDLRTDARFQAMLAANFKQPQAMWGPGGEQPGAHPALAQIIPLYLDKYGEVLAEQNRYVIADGCVPSFCPAAGLLWIDLGEPHPLMVFAAVNWDAQGHATGDAAAAYNLWLFPNRTLSADALPFALTSAIAHWDARLAAAHRLVPHIDRAVLVEPDGSPFSLEPALTGANTLPPQPDTLTPEPSDN